MRTACNVPYIWWYFSRVPEIIEVVALCSCFTKINRDYLLKSNKYLFTYVFTNKRDRLHARIC